MGAKTICIIAWMAISGITICYCNSPVTSSETTFMKMIDRVPGTEIEKTNAVQDAAKPATVPLTVIIKKLASSNAPVIVGVYGVQNKFPDPKGQLKEYKFKPLGKNLTAKIKDLPYGTYALAIYQDVNSSGKINKNFIGIPTEPYGFSNNYKPKIKAPGFDDCKFVYSAKNNTVTITMVK